jgi:hypothetical protein
MILTLMLAAAAPASTNVEFDVRIEGRCRRSPYPSECLSSGHTAYNAREAVRRCVKGADNEREKQFSRHRLSDVGIPTQDEMDEHCGDLVQICLTSWRAFYKRRYPKMFETGQPFDPKVADDECLTKAPVIQE